MANKGDGGDYAAYTNDTAEDRVSASAHYCTWGPNSYGIGFYGETLQHGDGWSNSYYDQEADYLID